MTYQLHFVSWGFAKWIICYFSRSGGVNTRSSFPFHRNVQWLMVDLTYHFYANRLIYTVYIARCCLLNSSTNAFIVNTVNILCTVLSITHVSLILHCQASLVSDGARHIEHYQFTSWADQIVSENSSPILALHRKALSNPPLEGPIIVHCRYLFLEYTLVSQFITHKIWTDKWDVYF